MSVKVFCTAFLLIISLSLVQANIALPHPFFEPELTRFSDYTGKIVEIRGFHNFPGQEFYLVNAIDSLILEQIITSETLRIITTGQKKYYISMDSTLAAWQPGRKYGPEKYYISTRSTLPVQKKYKPGTPEYEFFKLVEADRINRGPESSWPKPVYSKPIGFPDDWGYKIKGTKKKMVSFSIQISNEKMTDETQEILNPSMRFSLEPDRRNYPNSQYYDDRGDLNLRGFIWQTLSREYYVRKFHTFISKIDKRNNYQHFSPERRAYEQRRKWYRLYNKTLGYKNNHQLLHESYEHVETVMRENRRAYAGFFLFAALLTILIELLVLFILFNPITLLPLKENAGTLVLACVLGTGFTITILWWALPSLLHTYAKITMGGELFALIVESFVYYFAISKIRYLHAFFLSFFCNAMSYLFGLWVFRMIFLFI
ncbi:MAG: hypothetical protein R6V77_04570 [Candidatus Cloacimonadaceae bacterium]